MIASALPVNTPGAKELIARNPIPIPVHYAMMYASALVSLVSGIALLRSQNWARFLYAIWTAIGLLVGIGTSPLKLMLIPGVVMFVVIAFFLFRPKANQYFSGNGGSGVAKSH